MAPFDDKVLRRMFMSDEKLNEKFQEFLSEGHDRFGKVAVKMMYCQYILTNPQLLEQYEELHRWEYYVPYVEVVDEIYDLFHRVGWKRFMVALIFAMKRLKVKQKGGTINERRVDVSLEHLEKVPQTVEL
jgi:hypothetical protein